MNIDTTHIDILYENLSNYFMFGCKAVDLVIKIDVFTSKMDDI